MSAKFKAIESEFTVTLSTGTEIRYEYKRESDGEIKVSRFVIVSEDKTDTSISEIEADGKALVMVAQQMRDMTGLPRV